MRRITVIYLALMLCAALFSQEKNHAFNVNERLGRGINIGNTFEAPSETEWGNPWNPEYCKIISELGFNHIRVPIRWEPSDRSMANAPYTIEPEFMERIKSVIDEALKYKLHVIINMHHHEALVADPSGQKERFLSQWEQIATYFSNYPDSLVFEVLNEPNGNITPAIWNQLAADALAGIRKTNPDRIVSIGTAEWGGIAGLSQLQLPDDENLIVTIHYYNPFEFTHQGADWSNMQDVKDVKWYDTEAERETIHQEFAAVKAFAQNNNVPVHIGEFGAYNKADMDSRARWTTYLARWFEEQGFSWAYWEFSAGFGIYDPATERLAIPLVNALLHNPIPEPAKVELTSVYKSNFQNNADGWNIYCQGGAEATATVNSGKLETTVITKGTEGWHIQLTKYDIPLEKDQVYQLSFKAMSTVTNPTTGYVGRNADPWDAYGDYNVATLTPTESTYSFVFTMKEPSDPAARFVFDLGTFDAPSTVTFSEIRLDKVQVNPTKITQLKETKIIPCYFSSMQDRLYITNESNYTAATIYSATGSLVSRHKLAAGINEINCNQWNSGVYILILESKDQKQSTKIHKRK